MAESTKKKWELSFFNTLVMIILALLVGAGGMYAFVNFKQPGSGNEFEQVQSYIGGFMELPVEVPQFATVSDVTKLRNQTFFAKAQNGDKVLIYPVAHMAILYRPSTKKIISVGPINIQEPVVPETTTTLAVSVAPQKTGTPEPTKTAKVTVAIYNSTSTAGLAKSAEQVLKESFPAGSVVLRKDAKGEYEKTIVVDLSGKQKTQAEAFAKAVKGTVGLLPEGEVKPTADLLLILGADYIK